MSRRNQKSRRIPSYASANPGEYVHLMHGSLGRESMFETLGRFMLERRITRENRKYLEEKIRDTGGEPVRGYVGVSAHEAEQLAARPNRRGDPTHQDVFAWDTLGILEAIRDAERAAHNAGESGRGQVVPVRLEHARPSRTLLGYVAAAENVVVDFDSIGELPEVGNIPDKLVEELELETATREAQHQTRRTRE